MVSMTKIFSKNFLSCVLIIVMVISLYIYMNKKEGFNVGSQENSENTTNCTDDDSNLAQYLSILNREIMTCS